jgi:CBS domain-containing protein
MTAAHRRRFIEAAEPVHFAPDEVVLEPSAGIVEHLYFVRQGGVSGEQRLGAPGPFAIEAGELFPVSAVLGGRAVTASYKASGDTFCLRVPAAVARALVADSAPFGDFVNRRMLQLLELSQRALQGRMASAAVAEPSLEAPLARFVGKKPPLSVLPATPLVQALQAMQAQRVGSVLVTDEAGAAVGILTRHDMLDRVVLPRRDLTVPIAEVMSAPVHTLDVEQRAHDAALLMSREGVRHVPITERGRVVGIVSERDLFALQRLSLRQLGGAIDGAPDIATLQEAAADIRRFAAQLLAQGVQARALTELISHLNDRLAARCYTLLAVQQGLDPMQGCWLAFGSEGRGEQTIATDQDNGLIHPGDQSAWLALGEAVNQALDACGYPLCQGGVMAGRPACCLTAEGWRERFAHWIDHGAPQDLLNASIFFDLRPVAGNRALADPLQRYIAERAAATPRFLKQMAVNALEHRPPLAWHGGIAGDAIDLWQVEAADAGTRPPGGRRHAGVLPALPARVAHRVVIRSRPAARRSPIWSARRISDSGCSLTLASTSAMPRALQRAVQLLQRVQARGVHRDQPVHVEHQARVPAGSCAGSASILPTAPKNSEPNSSNTCTPSGSGPAGAAAAAR